MTKIATPDASKIAEALRQGGLDAVDELHYPGERSRHAARMKGYPKPEGTGRKRWEPETRYVKEIELPEYKTGVITRWSVWKGDVKLGNIERVRRGFCDNYFRAQDGEEFAHWGGPTGIDTYILERYWLYGDPEKRIIDMFGYVLKRAFCIGIVLNPLWWFLLLAVLCAAL